VQSVTFQIDRGERQIGASQIAREFGKFVEKETTFVEKETK